MNRSHRTYSYDFRVAALIVALALTAWLSFASTAIAGEPTGDFAIFNQCPRFTPKMTFCLYSKTTGGEARFGSLKVPIKHPIVMQGGIIRVYPEAAVSPELVVGALDNETLSKAPQAVPGGVLGVVPSESLSAPMKKLFAATIGNGMTGLTATIELAAPAASIGFSKDNFANEQGIALSLPIKVHLENPFLGNNCYLGSNASPITLNLTTGRTSPPPPNMPISGKSGRLEFTDHEEIAVLAKFILVDDALAVPGANGCGGTYSSLIDPLMDAKLGLPSAAGHNAIIQSGSSSLSDLSGVLASER